MNLVTSHASELCASMQSYCDKQREWVYKRFGPHAISIRLLGHLATTAGILHRFAMGPQSRCFNNAAKTCWSPIELITNAFYLSHVFSLYSFCQDIIANTKYRSLKTPQNAAREIALWVISNRDPSFKNLGSQRITMKTIERCGLPVFVKDIDSTRDLAEEISSLASKSIVVKKLIISCHGESYMLQIGQDDLKTDGIWRNGKLLSDEPHILSHAFRILDPDGEIVLIACNAGGNGNSDQGSIAYTVALMAPGRTITASNQLVHWTDLVANKDENSELKFEFLSLTWQEGVMIGMVTFYQLPLYILDTNTTIQYVTLVLRTMDVVFFFLSHRIFQQFAHNSTVTFKA